MSRTSSRCQASHSRKSLSNLFGKVRNGWLPEPCFCVQCVRSMDCQSAAPADESGTRKKEDKPIMHNRSLGIAVYIGLAVMMISSVTSALAAQAPFYEGKTLRVLIASGPG